MSKKIPKLPKEKQKGTYLYSAPRLEGVVARKGIKPKRKKKSSRKKEEKKT